MSRPRSRFRNCLEFGPAWLLLKLLGLLPRRHAISTGKLVARGVFRLHARLRETGHRNLEMAMPDLTADQRIAILKEVFTNLGRLLGEFSQFPKLTTYNIGDIVVCEGVENYRTAVDKGRGLLILTGHVGAWELSSFAHGMFGHPMRFLVRALDNPLLDRMINRYRELSGNRVIDKNRSVRPVLEALRRGEEVGVLIDANTLADQGVFCDFFGVSACSTTGLAVFALRSDAPVVPAFLIWDEHRQKHRLCFEPEVPLMRTGDFREEVRVNTARFTKVIEERVRRHPGQWLWIHRRWNTRPEGDPDLYRSRKTAVPADRVSVEEARA